MIFIKSTIMTPSKASGIKNWIKDMGFILAKSHILNSRSRKIKYYTLGSFGIYEETPIKSAGRPAPKPAKFMSWTPWGDQFEVTSVRELSEAYADCLKYNPDVVLN